MAYHSLSVSILTLLALALVSAGCTGSRRGGSLPRDSGRTPVDSGDDGTDAPTPPDSGIVLMDSGTPVPECDTTRPCPVGQTCVSGTCRTDTTPECSASRPCPSGQTCNASGVCITDTTTCTGDTVMYTTGAYCSSSTATCIDGCTDGTCAQACIDADPSEDCGACININSISCTNSNGCQPQWNLYICCVEDNCGPDASSSCVDSAIAGACSGQVASWRSCGDTVDLGTVCPSLLADCF